MHNSACFTQLQNLLYFLYQHGVIEATLTIDGATIKFADSKSALYRTGLQVEPGGSLIIKNSSKLTTFDCNGSETMWDGIEVQGETERPLPIYQGLIDISGNSIIENARIGIYLGKTDFTEYIAVKNDSIVPCGGKDYLFVKKFPDLFSVNWSKGGGINFRIQPY